jgi:ferritin
MFLAARIYAGRIITKVSEESTTMLSKKMEDALNGQLNAEMFSAYLYLSMAACFESINMQGMAKWMTVQAKEEHGHAMKFYDFIVDRAGRVKLAAIAAPETEWASPLAAFEAAYGHEQKVTGLIGELVKLAKAEGDVATSIFLQWFVTEQVEEEKSTSEIVQKLKMVKDMAPALLMLDGILGQRGG